MMRRETARRTLWGVAPGALQAELDRRCQDDRRRTQALLAQLDAERAEQERLDADLRAGAERLRLLQAECERSAHSPPDPVNPPAPRQAAADMARPEVQSLRLAEVRLRADLAEAESALRETARTLRSALPRTR